MKRQVRELVEQYIDGWKENNVEKIIKPLAHDCVIIESHGTTYHGIEQVRQWLNLWKQEQGRVNRWDITEFYFLEEERIAFVEWDFVCTASGKDYALLGISVVKFSGEKIVFMHEYRMTKNPYDWNAKQLNAE